MADYKWVNPEPGKLTMDGYPFRIEMVDGDFVWIGENGKKSTPFRALSNAKLEAEMRCDEMREIGVCDG